MAKVKKPKSRKSAFILLEEKMEHTNLTDDLSILKSLKPSFEDPFDYDNYCLMWTKYFPPTFSPMATSLIRKHLEEIKENKTKRTREAAFQVLEDKIEDKEDLTLLASIYPTIDFENFDIASYIELFKPLLNASELPLVISKHSSSLQIKEWAVPIIGEEYSQLLLKNEIDGDVLLNVNEDDLLKIGLPYGSVNKLLRNIKATKDSQKQTPPLPSTPKTTIQSPTFSQTAGSTSKNEDSVYKRKQSDSSQVHSKKQRTNM